MAQDTSDLGSFLAGFIIGGLIGAGAALLLAPQSGEETRTLIRDKSIELKDKAVATAEDVRVRAEQLAQETKEKATDFVEDQKMRLRSGKDVAVEEAEAGSEPVAG